MHALAIYYDESTSPSEQNPDCFVEDHPNCVREPPLPVIVFRDLLGREPIDNEILEQQINLAKVPVRTVDTTQGPGGHWSTVPEEYRSLLPQLFDGEWNMVFSDDTTADWSELTITFVLPSAPVGDLTGDNLVDRNDLNIITHSTGWDTKRRKITFSLRSNAVRFLICGIRSGIQRPCRLRIRRNRKPKNAKH